MSQSETRQRTMLVGVRLTPDEHKAAAIRAHALGLSIPEYLRASARLDPAPDLSEFDCETCGGPCTYEGPITDASAEATP